MTEKTDIMELCSRDPLSLSDEEVAAIIEHYRSDRAKHKMEALSAKAGKRKKSPSKNEMTKDQEADLLSALDKL